MAYDKTLLKNKLSEISKNTFKEAIFLSYKNGCTSSAPLGWSGDNIVLFGTEENGRRSLVSIRNYCGDAELLITDVKGNFLFYGRFDVNLGLEFLADQYYRIFRKVKKEIQGDLPNISKFSNIEIKADTTYLQRFNLLKISQKLSANANKTIQRMS